MPKIPDTPTEMSTEDSLSSPDSFVDVPNSSSTDPISAFTSHLNTSALNTPASQTYAMLNNEEADDEFIVPVIEIKSPDTSSCCEAASPIASEHSSLLLTELPFSDSDFGSSLIPSSSPSSTFSSNDVYEPIPDTSIPNPRIVVPDSIDQSTSTDSSISTLSLVSTSEPIHPSDCYPDVNNRIMVDLHAISDNESLSHAPESTPFVTQAILYGPGAKTSCFQANMDDGAMVNVIDLKAFMKASRNLKKLTRSTRILRMANRSEVPSHGVWTGTFHETFLASLVFRTELPTDSVFDSGGVWNMLIGKPLLEQLQATHDYTSDTIIIPATPRPYIIPNIFNSQAAPKPKSTPGPIPVHTSEAPDHQIEDKSLVFLTITVPADPKQPVPSSTIPIIANEHFVFVASKQCTKQQLDIHIESLSQAGAQIVVADCKPQLSLVSDPSSIAPCSPILFTASDPKPNDQPPTAPVWPILDNAETNDLREIPEFPPPTKTAGVYTRHTSPFNPARVAEVLQQIKIGDDLSLDQRTKVRDLCAEFADTFALAVSEVFPVDFKTFKLTFPEGMKFNTKVNQRSLTPPQCKFLYERLNELEKAGIIHRIAPEDVKAASPTILAQKAHGTGSLTLEELLHHVNDQCIAHGLPTRNDLPQRPANSTTNAGTASTPKWQVTSGLNNSDSAVIVG
ncbi:hypothetical protein EV702DRAFT_1198948 [Suillus placidus]|uniref:Uncharacterized protein n=1 Tax=Suillus placidus TaxID=48579 RepID=A0A9P6ZTV4_9AGAM|nr:hypothetical protein EV702DRAFT_1198948 [Suillus placidus]